MQCLPISKMKGTAKNKAKTNVQNLPKNFCAATWPRG